MLNIFDIQVRMYLEFVLQGQWRKFCTEVLELCYNNTACITVSVKKYLATRVSQ